MIKAEILSDSLNPKGKRLTTFVLEYPRMIHAEILTHRVFSKNAASSRAIPIEKMIQQVMDNPAMPVWWGKNQSGMQAKEELDNIMPEIPTVLDENGNSYAKFGRMVHPAVVPAREAARRQWLHARNLAVEQVRHFNTIGVHKQLSNRLLEPWFNIRVILSGTDFENFFSLRAHKDAQPEFQSLAYKMLDIYNASTPNRLTDGQWHIPFGDNMDEGKLKSLILSREDIYDDADYFNKLEKYKIKVAIARCARVSYWNFEGKDDYAKDVETCDKLFGSIPRHLSPAEHVAKSSDTDNYTGNFCGFIQYRKLFEDENLKDNRVIKK
jgi:thymidylate synthase ThyX